MPLDPSIISNSMANMAGNMPDVNALMQQRVQGAENVYKIETARQEQAKEEARLEQERANKAAAEAMLPSVAAAYNDPSDAGLDRAVSLMPEEVRDTFAPFVARLKGISDPATRKTILEAELAKDPAGRAVLDRVMTPYQAAVTGIQREQNVLARGRLAIDQQKAALDALGQGDWELKEGEGGFFWTNPRTRQVIPADVTGGAAPAAAAPAAAVPGPTPIPAPDVVTPRMPETGVPAAEAPISTAQPPGQQPQFRPKVKTSAEQTQEERRRAAAVRYAVKNVDKVLETIDKDPASFGQGADEFALSLVPFGAAEDFKSFVQDANRQQVYYRMNQTVATLLRLATGAAFTSPELVTEAGSYMPKYGDEPETARDKLDALQDRVLSEVGSTGRGFTPEDQAELDALLGAFEAMKDKLYPAGSSGAAPSAGGDEIDTSNPLLQD
jgi:hypothetical protein